MMSINDDDKSVLLKGEGALHPNPDKVSARLFVENDFFDPRDLVQVKYEMLRCIRQDKYSISEAVQMYGLSRPSFYKARDRFEKEGVAGLLPRKRGPKNAHKLTGDVLRFVTEKLEAHSGDMCWKNLSRMVEAHFSKKIHPRSIERSIKQRKKGG